MTDHHDCAEHAEESRILTALLKAQIENDNEAIDVLTDAAFESDHLRWLFGTAMVLAGYNLILRHGVDGALAECARQIDVLLRHEPS
jgi:hypothetical protein